MTNYYNENDPKAAAWLRQIISDGLIPDGEVDERSIADVYTADLIGFTQHHFFAGIGGWSLALQLAGWPEDKPVWTGSCPCQPFSAAGNKKGKKDERHLWPEFYRLIKEYQPNIVFGEQVESAIKHGWLDELQTDLERENYAVGHCVLGAHSINAAHIRQRLYWVGYAEHKGYDADQVGRETSASEEQSRLRESERSSEPVHWLECRDGKHRPIKPGIKPLVDGLPKGVVYGCDPGHEVDNTQEARIMRLKGYGNSIVPNCGKVFIQSFMGIEHEKDM